MPNNNRTISATAKLTLVIVALSMSLTAHAGDINPPAGPITSTMMSLDEVRSGTPISSLPFTINLPGSYYITRDLVGLSGQAGITINSNDVTVDLGGFTLHGVPGSLDGIVATGASRLVVKNGMVTAWGADGIDLSSGSNEHFENLIVDQCGGRGFVGGPRAKWWRCTTRSNGSEGFESLGVEASFVSCSASDNSRSGFKVSSLATFRDCTTSRNSMMGFNASTASALFTNCIAQENGRDGFNGGKASSFFGCIARNNAIGSGSGIDAGAGSIIVNCSVIENGQWGIVAASASLIQGCSIWNSGFAGIVSTGGIIRDNVCHSNGEVGISVTLGRCIVEGNVITAHVTGVKIENGAQCEVSKNRFSGNVASKVSVGAGAIATIAPFQSVDTATSPWANLDF